METNGLAERHHPEGIESLSRFRPRDLQEAIKNARSRPSRPRQPISRGKGFQRRRSGLQVRQSAQKPPITAKLKAVDPKLAAWGREVKRRDGNRCQWVECEFCRGREDVTMDPHHRALRSARPDLRLVLGNGVTVCRDRHNWIHSPAGHDEAGRLGFLNPRTRELAAKEGTLGVY